MRIPAGCICGTGEILESGMSAVRVEDGDEIVIFFTLDFGKEYNGVWFSGSW